MMELHGLRISGSIDVHQDGTVYTDGVRYGPETDLARRYFALIGPALLSGGSESAVTSQRRITAIDYERGIVTYGE